jgi:membrane protein YqaA with SNARE-associated domain
MLRKIYDWCIRAAEKPYAVWLLGIVSFAESSFFPVPPDVMLVPMALARPDRAYFYATVCTVTSVLGGLLGYLIGALLYESIGQWIIHFYGAGQKVDLVRQTFQDYGAWVIVGKGITPIPYKLVTIVAGFSGYNLLSFILFSLIARGIRFYAFAFVLHRYGPQAREIIEKRLGFWVTVSAVTIVAGFVIVVYLF